MKKELIINSIPLLSNLTGIGRYNNEICIKFKQKDMYDMYYYYGFISKKYLTKENRQQLGMIKSIIRKLPFFKYFRKIILYVKSIITQSKFDIYWEPNFIPQSDIKALKIVTTVHDLSFILQPEWHPKDRIKYFNTYFFKNIERSDRIITVSKFIKNEIIEHLGFNEKKISVIYNGVDHEIFKVYDQKILQITKSTLNISKHFILFVGSVEPRKNLILLLEAYSLLDKTIKKKFNFLLVGFKGWNNTKVMDIIKREEQYIQYLGYLSDQELAHVYNLASLFVYPSHYEGFGIPPIEAMACGTPVIVSNAASLPEVCADAALYCDLYDANDLKEKMTDILTHTKLSEQLRIKGLKHAKQYSWEKSATQHHELFQSLLENETIKENNI